MLSGGRLWKANLLGPGNIVVSGEKSALEVVEPIALELGAGRVIPLAVAGAFHTPLMKPADLKEYAEFMRVFEAAAEAAMKAGRSVDEAAGSLKLPATFKDYDMANAKADVQRVYDELKPATR